MNNTNMNNNKRQLLFVNGDNNIQKKKKIVKKKKKMRNGFTILNKEEENDITATIVKTCIICLDKVPRALMRPCLHLIACAHCINIYLTTDLSKKPICPLCKEEITEIEYLYV
jgi:hypothetical protein